MTALTIGITSALALTAASGKYKGHFKYKGTPITSEVLTFKVSGNKVKMVRITPFLPSKCGAGGGPPKETSKNGTIKNGKFTAAAEVIFQGKVTAKATIKGTFTASNKVKGTIKSKLKNLPSCGASYTFTAQKK